MVLILLAASSLFQASFLPAFLPAGPRPDITLGLVVSWSILRGTREGIIWGGFGGIFLAFLSGLPFGIPILFLTFTALLASLAQGSVYRSNLLFPLAAVFISSLAYNLSLGLLRLITSHSLLELGFWSGMLLRVILPQTLWNTLLTIPIYALLSRLHLATGPARLGW